MAPNNWAVFLRNRLDSLAAHVLMDGVERTGWKPASSDDPTDYGKAMEQSSRNLDASRSIGLALSADGLINDVLPVSPAAKTGLIPGMNLIAVNGWKWSGDGLPQALKNSNTSAAPLEFITENGSFGKVFKVDVHGGERYPRLTRIEGTPDRLKDTLSAKSH